MGRSCPAHGIDSELSYHDAIAIFGFRVCGTDVGDVYIQIHSFISHFFRGLVRYSVESHSRKVEAF